MEKLIVDGKRIDGRKVDEMRPLEAKVGVIPNADGSAMFRMGKTIAIAGVYGPRPVFPKKEENAKKTVLRVRYNMAPFSTKERNRPGLSRRSQEISAVIRKALESVVFLDEFPKSVIDINIEILEADASTRCVGLNAASLALADAGVRMRDLVSSCASGKIDGQIVLDIAGEEDTEGELDMPIAYSNLDDKITLLQMDGIASTDEIKEMVKLSIDGCKKIYEKQKETLREKYNGELNDRN